jgi:NAD(P)-dependent dehydrogenase (short-subunit alcohol dehydrogenase family)
MKRMQDKVTIITGAGTGVGRACMELFAKEGAKVVGASRTQKNLSPTRDTVVERIFRDARAFRIYDGPSEVHRWSIGRRIVEGDKKAKG